MVCLLRSTWTRAAVLALWSALLLAPAGCQSSENDLPVIQSDIPFRADGTLTFERSDGTTIRTINIEIAESDSAKARGLMERRSLSYRQGMLFIDDAPNTEGFWMKNTPLSLDIVFVGPDSQVVSIARRTTPYSETTITPAAPKQFTVEVRTGFADRYGLTEKTRIRWQRD
jgi:hypothetical protein